MIASHDPTSPSLDSLARLMNCVAFYTSHSGSSARKCSSPSESCSTPGSWPAEHGLGQYPIFSKLPKSNRIRLKSSPRRQLAGATGRRLTLHTTLEYQDTYAWHPQEAQTYVVLLVADWFRLFARVMDSLCQLYAPGTRRRVSRLPV
jgi:hypothetical protein